MSYWVFLISICCFVSVNVCYGGNDVDEPLICSVENDSSFYFSDMIPSCLPQLDENECYQGGKENGYSIEDLKDVYDRLQSTFSKGFLGTLASLEGGGKDEFSLLDTYYECSVQKLCVNSIVNSCAIKKMYWMYGINQSKDYDLVVAMSRSLTIIASGYERFELFFHRYLFFRKRIAMYSKFQERPTLDACVDDPVLWEGVQVSANENGVGVEYFLKIYRCSEEERYGYGYWILDINSMSWVQISEVDARKIREVVAKQGWVSEGDEILSKVFLRG